MDYNEYKKRFKNGFIFKAIDFEGHVQVFRSTWTSFVLGFKKISVIQSRQTCICSLCEFISSHKFSWNKVLLTNRNCVFSFLDLYWRDSEWSFWPINPLLGKSNMLETGNFRILAKLTNFWSISWLKVSHFQSTDSPNDH